MGFVFVSGHFCSALPKAIKTMKRGEKVRLIVQPQCMSLDPCCQTAMSGKKKKIESSDVES